MHKSLCLLLPLLFASACTQPSDSSWDTVVDAGFRGRPGAEVAGVPCYPSLSQALAAAPAGDTPWRVLMRKGRYHEKVRVDRANLHLLGESREETILSFDACGDTPAPDGTTLGTRGSATLTIQAPGFFAERMTIENNFDYPANALRADTDPAKIAHSQAVAVMIAAGSDRTTFIDCVISGFQDTLFPDAGRALFSKCRILGHVDFIFGAGQALFEACEIVSRDRPGKNPTGYITAPSTPASYPYGFLFLDCRLLKETPELPRGSVRLGRPWHPQGDLTVSGSAVFLHCWMDDHIGPEGYAAIGATDSSGRKLSFEIEPDSRFFEFGSHGPGTLASPARPRLTAEAAAWYTREQLLRGWKP